MKVKPESERPFMLWNEHNSTIYAYKLIAMIKSCKTHSQLSNCIKFGQDFIDYNLYNIWNPPLAVLAWGISSQLKKRRKEINEEMIENAEALIAKSNIFLNKIKQEYGL